MSSSSNGKGTPPLETKVKMDNDYDYYVSKYSSQPPPPPPPGPPPKKETTYNLGVSPMERESVDGEEALMDLVQLEELHHEAERMKALGNKHMAAQVSFILGVVRMIQDSRILTFPNILCSGIYSRLQCLFSSTATFSRGTLLACLSFESFCFPSFIETVFSSSYRCSQSYCSCSYLRKSSCSAWTIFVLPKGLRGFRCRL